MNDPPQGLAHSPSGLSFLDATLLHCRNGQCSKITCRACKQVRVTSPGLGLTRLKALCFPYRLIIGQRHVRSTMPNRDLSLTMYIESRKR